MAPVSRAVPLFSKQLRRGIRLLLYKGPDAENEIAEARLDTAVSKWNMRVVSSYQLPDGLGSRTIVEICR